MDMDDTCGAQFARHAKKEAVAIMADLPTGSRAEIACGLNWFALQVEDGSDELLLSIAALLLVMSRHLCDHIGEGHHVGRPAALGGCSRPRY